MRELCANSADVQFALPIANLMTCTWDSAKKRAAPYLMGDRKRVFTYGTHHGAENASLNRKRLFDFLHVAVDRLSPTEAMGRKPYARSNYSPSPMRNGSADNACSVSLRMATIAGNVSRIGQLISAATNAGITTRWARSHRPRVFKWTIVRGGPVIAPLWLVRWSSMRAAGIDLAWQRSSSLKGDFMHSCRVFDGVVAFSTRKCFENNDLKSRGDKTRLECTERYLI